MMIDRQPLEKLLASFTNKSLIIGLQLINTVKDAGYTFDEFAQWLLDHYTFNLVGPEELDRISFLTKHKADRERFKSGPKTPCNPCRGDSKKV